MLDYNDFPHLLNDLKKSVSEFHAHFAKINTEIEIVCGRCTVLISKERIAIIDMDEILEDPFNLHWMSNLNANSVREVIKRYWDHPTILKFINYCADETFDVATLMHPEFKFTETLDITSNGPIIVNANVSEIFASFRFLMILTFCFLSHFRLHAIPDSFPN